MRNILIPAVAACCLLGAAHSATADARSDANIQLVKNYVHDIRDAAFVKHDKDLVRKVAEQYMAADYNQNKEGVTPDREGYIGGIWGMAQTIPAGAKLELDDIYFMADDDHVTWLTRHTVPDPTAPGKIKYTYVLNMVRIENGKLKEHWGG
jgi:predicted SnoaL-like aldol condensation-catalyzing enzyme